MVSTAPSALPNNSDNKPSTLSDPSLSWEGDKMFNIYIHDYCLKRGFLKTASELLSEAEILPESGPPINAKQGLLFEWWSVFWVLFTAKSSGQGTDDAMLYTTHQANQSMVRQASRSGPPGPGGPQNPGMNRYPNGLQRPAGGLMPTGQPMSNGPQGGPQGMIPSGPAPFPMPPPGGQPPSNGAGGPQQPQQPQNPGPPGQNFPPHMLGPHQRQLGGNPRNTNGAPFQSPTMANSPQGGGPPGQQPSQGGQPLQHGGTAPMGHLGAPPQHGGRPPMMPPTMGNGMMNGGGGPGFQAMGRSPSRTGTPGHTMMQGPGPGPSPSLAARQVPQAAVERNMLEMQFSNDFRSMPPQMYQAIAAEAGVARERLMQPNEEEKKRMQNALRSRARPMPPNLGPGPHNAAAGPSNPMQLPMRGQPQRLGKRSSTSPEEDHNTLPHNDSSPPERKRLRPSPPGMDGQPGQQHPGPTNPMPFNGGGPQHGGNPPPMRGGPLTSAGQNIFPNQGPGSQGMGGGGGMGGGMGQPGPMSLAMSPPGGMGQPGQMSQAQLQHRQQQHYNQQSQYPKLNHGPMPGGAGSPPSNGSFNGGGPFPDGPPARMGSVGGNKPMNMSPGMNGPGPGKDHRGGPHGGGPGGHMGAMGNGQHPDGLGQQGQGQGNQSGPGGTNPPTPIPGQQNSNNGTMNPPSPGGGSGMSANPGMSMPENMFTDEFPDFTDGLVGLSGENGLGGFSSFGSSDQFAFDSEISNWFNPGADSTDGGLDMK